MKTFWKNSSLALVTLTLGLLGTAFAQTVELSTNDDVYDSPRQRKTQSEDNNKANARYTDLYARRAPQSGRVSQHPTSVEEGLYGMGNNANSVSGSGYDDRKAMKDGSYGKAPLPGSNDDYYYSNRIRRFNNSWAYNSYFNDPFLYGPYGGYYGNSWAMNPYGAWYNPMMSYSPWNGLGWGTAFSYSFGIGFGAMNYMWGNPWGFGSPFGYPYYYPYSGLYDPFYASRFGYGGWGGYGYGYGVPVVVVGGNPGAAYSLPARAQNFSGGSTNLPNGSGLFDAGRGNGSGFGNNNSYYNGGSRTGGWGNPNYNPPSGNTGYYDGGNNRGGGFNNGGFNGGGRGFSTPGSSGFGGGGYSGGGSAGYGGGGGHQSGSGGALAPR